MMLHPESREEVRQLLTQPPDLDSVLEGMETSTIRLALRDSALLASVDGDYDKAEIKVLTSICEAAGLEKKDLNNILEWVSKSWENAALGRDFIALPLPGDEDIINRENKNQTLDLNFRGTNLSKVVFDFPETRKFTIFPIHFIYSTYLRRARAICS